MRCPKCRSQELLYAERAEKYWAVIAKEGKKYVMDGHYEVAEEGDDPHLVCTHCATRIELEEGYETDFR